MELENVNSQTQEQPFRFNFFLSAGKESTEIHNEFIAGSYVDVVSGLQLTIISKVSAYGEILSV